MKRNIILIDEEKCNGCGQCVTSCAESALQIVNEKAKLVKEIYCDGLGACIGTCPTGALTIVQREAEAFDEKATGVRVQEQNRLKNGEEKLPCGCPGSMVMEFGNRAQTAESAPLEQKSELTNWPVQLKLVPVNAPYFTNADLLIAADCTAFSVAGFQTRFVKDKKLLIACPKLDDAGYYQEKLSQIFSENSIKSISVVRMEVPCCGGLSHIVREAIRQSGKDIPYGETIIGIKGDVKK
jgi:Pyruvate/2-oxoacid:ferredoxin oxidoreductase delta subunit